MSLIFSRSDLEDLFDKDIRRVFSHKSLSLEKHWLPFLHIKSLLLKYIDNKIPDFYYYSNLLEKISDDCPHLDLEYINFADTVLISLSINQKNFNSRLVDKNFYRGSAQQAYLTASDYHNHNKSTFYMLYKYFILYEKALQSLFNDHISKHLLLVINQQE